MPEEHVDVLIVGAGLSGIGAACHLRRECPDKTFAILEAREAIGGTWDLFRYPGIRSDSDMFTLGYAFKPWTQAKAIADGDSIRDYVRETAREYGVDRAVRFGHRVVRAEWSSERAAWTVEAVRADTGETVRMTCSLLFACSGYYRYDRGYTPEFDGIADFAGPVVHPQHWPEDLDYRGKRVLVIGSGATAVTLVPAMAETASDVTMLQRSPSYVVALPSVDPAAERLRRLLPTKAAYSVLRWRNMLRMLLLFQVSRRAPDLVKRLIRKGLAAQLPPGYDVETHFSPRYNPWDQRMCFVPDGDLLKAIRKGRASVVTDQIDRFTKGGVRLASGTELEADIIVTATGLDLIPMGGVTLSVDGVDVQFARTVAYKGMMLSGVPNFVYTLGYTNASWTLKSDLVARYVCRLLRHMDARGHRVATPKAPASTAMEPFIDLQSGYVKRVIDQMPKQGTSAPWRLHQNYPRDVLLLRHGQVDDKGIEFGRARAPRTAEAPAA